MDNPSVPRYWEKKTHTSSAGDAGNKEAAEAEEVPGWHLVLSSVPLHSHSQLALPFEGPVQNGLYAELLKVNQTRSECLRPGVNHKEHGIERKKLDEEEDPRHERWKSTLAS